MCSNIFGVFTFFEHGSWRTAPSICLAFPLSWNAVGFPTLREDLGNIYFVELLAPIWEAHPPSTIRFLRFKDILEFFFEASVFIPVVRIFTEGTIPHSIAAPWISNTNELEILLRELPHIKNTVEVVLQDTLRALISCLCGFFRVEVYATDEELLAEVGLQQIPKGTCFYSFLDFRNSQIESLTDSSCQIHESFQNITLTNTLITAMEFDIRLFNQRDPELLWVSAAAIHAGPRIGILLVRKQCVDNDLHPITILEELEAHKAFIKVFFLHDELLNLLGSAGQHR